MRPLLVLRPEPGAAATVAAARLLGLDAIGAPLFAIRPVALDLDRLVHPPPSGAPRPPPSLLREREGARAAQSSGKGGGNRPRPDALLVTSANAARAAFPGAGPGADAAAPDRDLDLRRGGAERPGWRHLPVYAVGHATAAAARAAGFTHVVTGTADAHAIVAQAAADGIRRLLHLTGREHRAVSHPQVAIDRVIVYAADAALHLPQAARTALAQGAVALLHSSRAAALFARLLDEAALPRPPIAALSPAVAVAAGPDWPAVAVASRPADAALLAAAVRLCEEGAGRPEDGR